MRAAVNFWPAGQGHQGCEPCRQDSTLGGLARLVSGLNESRPAELRPGRAIASFGMFLVLFGNDDRTPGWDRGYPFYDGRLLYRNMSVLGGTAFLEHPGVPHDAAYALLSTQAPVFVHGPSSLHCTEETLKVRRQCGFVDPPGGPGEIPWGVRLGVDMGYELEEARFRHSG